MSKHTFNVGDPVLVVGRICTVKTCLGLFGRVTKVHPDGSLSLSLLSHPTLEEESDIRAEKHGRFDTWTATANHEDLRHLTGKSRLARVAAHEANEEANQKPKRDSVADEIMADMFKPEAIAKRKEHDAAVEAEGKRIGQVFRLPGVIKRGDKSKFPAFHHPDVEAISSELMGYAASGPKDCTLTELARWKQCLAATDATSFWPGCEEVRAVVKEFDLDPMTDGYEDALWCKRGKAYVKNGELRSLVIRLWNQGKFIHQIIEMEDEDTCWSSYKDTKPAGFLVYFGSRRKLPVS